MFPAALIVLACLLAYGRTFSAPMVLDDFLNIHGNPYIRHLWPPDWLFRAPVPGSLGGRPVAHLSFAASQALGNGALWAHHAVNLAVHAAAALLLYGILCRAFRLPALEPRFGARARPLALAAALVFALHPIQIQAVTYLTQRVESLAGMLVLASFYAALRSWTGPRGRFFQAVSAACFFLAAGTKEVVAVFPFLLFSFDAAFVHNGPKRAISGSSWLYIGLLAGLAFLAALVSGGFQVRMNDLPATLSWGDYLRAQTQAVFLYLRLILWPRGLSFDYWGFRPPSPAAAFLYLAFHALVLSAAVRGLARRRPWGFAVAWFYAFLLPTSLVPLVNVVDEYRVYLSMAGASALFAGGGWLVLGRIWPGRERIRDAAGAGLAAVAVLALGMAAWERNEVYESPLSLWSDVLAKRPDNDLARYNVLEQLAAEGKTREAGLLYDELPPLGPFPAAVHLSLARLLSGLGKSDEALVHYRQAVVRDPGLAAARLALGAALLDAGRVGEAVESLKRAVALAPENGEAANDLGVALTRAGRADEALAAFSRALALRPGLLPALLNQGALLSRLGRHREAVETLERAVAARPDSAAAKTELDRARKRAEIPEPPENIQVK